MLRRPHRQPRARAHADDDMLAAGLQPAQLSGIFRAPAWLRDLGVASWLLVGVTGLLIGSVWILSLIDTIVIPVVTATIIAAVLSPVVRALARHMPRAAAAAIVFLSLIVLGAVVGLMVMSGIVDQAEQLQGSLQSAVDKAQEHLKDAGVSDSKAQSTGDDASANISSAFHALISGLGTGIEALAGVAIFLSFTALSLFFLLKDGPVIRAWAEAHMGVPAPVGKIVAGRTLQSLRGYFAGVTAVAAFNGVVIGLGAWALGVSEPGAIAIVNFVAAYVPYLGAWSAGAFTVLVAYGSEGTSAAIAMIVIVLLANGVLQQMIQPIAYGAALGIHPLAVLVVTIAGGALFGTIGLVLGAPLTSAVIKISSDVAKARAAEAEEEEAAPGAAAPEPAP
ncbi:MAG: AI-2E family transporter [Solirubrobacteraceae bacterium]